VSIDWQTRLSVAHAAITGMCQTTRLLSQKTDYISSRLHAQNLIAENSMLLPSLLNYCSHYGDNPDASGFHTRQF
jgi:hypothetical protein